MSPGTEHGDHAHRGGPSRLTTGSKRHAAGRRLACCSSSSTPGSGSGACGLGWTRAADLFPALLGWRAAAVPSDVASIAAGYYHSLAVTASGALYAWGCGTFTDSVSSTRTSSQRTC